MHSSSRSRLDPRALYGSGEHILVVNLDREEFIRPDRFGTARQFLNVMPSPFGNAVLYLTLRPDPKRRLTPTPHEWESRWAGQRVVTAGDLERDGDLHARCLAGHLADVSDPVRREWNAMAIWQHGRFARDRLARVVCAPRFGDEVLFARDHAIPIDEMDDREREATLDRIRVLLAHADIDHPDAEGLRQALLFRNKL